MTDSAGDTTRTCLSLRRSQLEAISSGFFSKEIIELEGNLRFMFPLPVLLLSNQKQAVSLSLRSLHNTETIGLGKTSAC